MNDLSDIDAAWLGGWISADGSILLGPPPKIRFTICDPDVLHRNAEVVGVNAVVGPTPPSGLGKLPRYSWAVSGAKALQLGERVRPWLSERYRHRLDEAKSRWTPRTHLGRVLAPADVLTIRSQLRAGTTGRELARHFNVSEGMVSAIKRGHAWKEVMPCV